MSSMFLGLTVFSALLSVSSAQYGRYILASPGVPPPLPAAYFDSPYGAPPPPPAQPYYIQSYALQAPPPPPAFPYGAPFPPPPQFSPIPEQPFGPPPSPFGPPPPPFAMPPPPPPFAMPPPFGPPPAFAPPPPFGAYGPPPPPAFMPPPPAFSPPIPPPLPPPVAVPAPIGIPFAVPVPTPAYLCKMAPCKKESPPSVVIKLTGPADSGPQNSPMGGMGGMQRNAPMNNGNSSPILRSPPAGMPAPMPVNGGGNRQMSPPMMNGDGGERLRAPTERRLLILAARSHSFTNGIIPGRHVNALPYARCRNTFELEISRRPYHYFKNTRNYTKAEHCKTARKDRLFVLIAPLFAWTTPPASLFHNANAYEKLRVCLDYVPHTKEGDKNDFFLHKHRFGWNTWQTREECAKLAAERRQSKGGKVVRAKSVSRKRRQSASRKRFVGKKSPGTPLKPSPATLELSEEFTPPSSAPKPPEAKPNESVFHLAESLTAREETQKKPKSKSKTKSKSKRAAKTAVPKAASPALPLRSTQPSN
ncbi:hypothetical protein M3Y99_00267900 [Aphelenchoides fujianensis]|nr:hypothetical protein M3Y99_00267900 [Aphelenchoides fujianensis]